MNKIFLLFFSILLIYTHCLSAPSLNPLPSGRDLLIFNESLLSIEELLISTLDLNLNQYVQYDYGYHVCPESTNPKFGYKNIEPYYRYFLKNKNNDNEKIYIQYSRSGVEIDQVTIDIDIVTSKQNNQTQIDNNTSTWIAQQSCPANYTITNKKLDINIRKDINYQNDINTYFINLTFRKTNNLGFFRKHLYLY